MKRANRQFHFQSRTITLKQVISSLVSSIYPWFARLSQHIVRSIETLFANVIICTKIESSIPHSCEYLNKIIIIIAEWPAHRDHYIELELEQLTKWKLMKKSKKIIMKLIYENQIILRYSYNDTVPKKNSMTMHRLYSSPRRTHSASFCRSV